MSARKDYCVGCEAPLVDETVEGDLRDGFSDDIRFENARDNKTFANMVVGSENGCRNCMLFLDASSFISTSKDQKRCRFRMTPRRRNRTLEIYFEVLGNGETGSTFMQVFRQSSQPQATESCDSVVWNLKEYRDLSENTSSHETLDLIASWATQCVECHEHCPQRLTSRLPKRVLKITADHVYLIETPNVSAPYACLSHCWGPHGPAIKLTADTVELLHKGYATSELPKTFRDAVNVCRRLGIDYLWIDALCILQDSQEDWKEAAATMANIYEHAYMTIAATSAQDSKGGLFSSARPLTTRLDKHPHLYIREYLQTFPYYSRTYPDYSCNKDVKPWPLLTRAWVYQERRLSTRTVHFGEHQVYWECQNCFISEDTSEDKVWKIDPDGCDGNIGWGDKIMNSTRQWQKIISEYTSLRLTYDSDRLPAISALADRMSRLQRSDDVYIAGLWRNSILSDMLWRSHSFEMGKWGQPLEPRPARLAPSWSWASVQNAKIHWSGWAFPDTTEIVSLNYTVIGAVQLGEVSNASIVLRTHVLDLTGTEISYPPWSLDTIDDIVRSSPPMGSFEQNNSVDINCSFAQDYDLTTADPPYTRGHVLKLLVSHDDHRVLGGIVVRQIIDEPVQWQRIGSLIIVFIKARRPGERVEMAWYGDNKWERRIEELIQSLPVEEVRIV